MIRFPNSTIVLFNTTGLNMNSTADQAIPIKVGNVASYMIRGIRAYGSSRAMATAVGGIYNGTGKPAGGMIVADTQIYSNITAANEGHILGLTPKGLDIRTTQTLYLSLTTPEGAAGTFSIIVWATPLS